MIPADYKLELEIIFTRNLKKKKIVIFSMIHLVSL